MPLVIVVLVILITIATVTKLLPIFSLGQLSKSIGANQELRLD